MKLDNEKVKELRKDFPIFKVKINNKPLIYLDNTATTQKPKQVINAIKEYYETTNANIHRGVYKLSEDATQKYEEAHKTVAKFINADEKEIIFTRNTTESINLLSYCLPSILNDRDEILLTEMEHHSNLVPWQQLAERNNMKLKFIKIKPDYTLDYDDAEKKITEKTAIVSITHISNALGTINDVKRIIKFGKKKGALTIVDAAQSVPHIIIDVKDLDCDFLAFSGHKMLGPTGIGVLYGRKDLLEKMSPFNFGGDMIKKVSYEGAEWNDLPMKFEAGTPHITGAIGLSSAINYLENISMDNIHAWEKELLNYALEKMKKIPGVVIYNSGIKNSSGIISFNIDKIHAHDVASIMNDYGVCIRGGHHCAMPLMNKLGITGTGRASFYFYNTFEDVDVFIQALKKAQEVFK